MTKEMKYRLLSSEKSFMMREQNKIVLITSDWIEQKEVIEFIENKYDTKVVKINSLVQKGKTKIRRRIKVTLPNKKKFYMTVDNCDKFDKVEKNNAEAV
jgi:large subunit ribosomal protein L23